MTARNFALVSFGLLCLALALAIVLHQLGEIAVASSTAPMATEVTTASGFEQIAMFSSTTVPWPTYPDGTQATQSECQGIASQRTNSANSGMSYTSVGRVAGLQISNSGSFAIFEYLIVCTRAAVGPVAAEQSTWGEIKSLYGE